MNQVNRFSLRFSFTIDRLRRVCAAYKSRYSRLRSYTRYIQRFLNSRMFVKRKENLFEANEISWNWAQSGINVICKSGLGKYIADERCNKANKDRVISPVRFFLPSSSSLHTINAFTGEQRSRQRYRIFFFRTI